MIKDFDDRPHYLRTIQRFTDDVVIPRNARGDTSEQYELAPETYIPICYTFSMSINRG